MVGSKNAVSAVAGGVIPQFGISPAIRAYYILVSKRNNSFEVQSSIK
jgi:hypothetical protein